MSAAESTKTIESNDWKRQAVVVIHGIGEQRPMSTLRGFVDSLLNYEVNKFESVKEVKNWVKPDRISDSYELRKITAQAIDNIRSTTHFYEYHWAGNMRDTRSWHVLRWLWSLMLRWIPDGKPTLVFLKYFSWILLIAWLAFPVGITLGHLFLSDHPFLANHSLRWIFLIALPFVFIQWFFPNIFVRFIGDAARYLRNDADNLNQREIIRKNGVEFLKGLHKDGDYDRIILVGHSLGSVIAYDLITYLWIDFNKSLKVEKVHQDDQVENKRWHGSLYYNDNRNSTLDKISKAALDFWAHFDKIKQNKEKGNLWLDLQNSDVFIKYRKLQIEFWNSIAQSNRPHRSAGWLISDLVTLGSPLTHGEILMAKSEKEFAQMKEERQFPSCPPVKDIPLSENDRVPEPKDHFVYGNRDKQRHLNHGTPFFPTRWTNLYFKGDFIGGPINSQFGPGVRDIEVKHNKESKWWWFHKFSPLAHNHYWASVTDSNTIHLNKEYCSIKEIYTAMRLNDVENLNTSPSKRELKEPNESNE